MDGDIYGTVETADWKPTDGTYRSDASRYTRRARFNISYYCDSVLVSMET